jgi:hypothetical protein
LLLEQQGLRVKLTLHDDGKRYCIEGMYKQAPHLAELLLQTNDLKWWTGLQNGLLVRRYQTDKRTDALEVLDTLRKTTILTRTPENEEQRIMELIRPLGNTQWLAPVPEVWTKKLHALISRTRALGACGAYADLWALLAALTPPGNRFSFIKEKLLNEPQQILTIIRESPIENGIIIVLDLGCLPHDSWRHLFVQAAEELNLGDAATGARLIFLQSDGATFPTSVPVIQLPDFVAANMEGGVLSPEEKTIGAILTRDNGLNEQQAIHLIRSARRSIHQDNHGTHRMAETSGTITASTEELRRCCNQVQTMLTRQIVGHSDILENLARKITLWFARTDCSTPLVLAFSGPSGVGKNLLCSTLADILAAPEFFNLRKSRYFSVNMALDRDGKQWDLLGVSVGHVGAQKKGLFENAVSEDGYVISFDEIDKQTGRHSDPQGFLISVLDQGGFRNGHAHFVPLKKGIIVLTLNCGPDASVERMAPVGFICPKQDRQKNIRQHYQHFYERHLIAPLRGRITSACFFGELTRENLCQLALGHLKQLWSNDQAAGLTWPDVIDLEELAESIVTMSKPEFGARGVLNEIRNYHERLHQDLLGTVAANPIPKKET